MAPRLRLSIIVPFRRNLEQLGACLSAIRRSAPDAELIVAADAAVDDCGPLASASGARLVVVPGPSGPAVARNRGAAVAGGDVLVFVDSDVVVSETAIPGMAALLDQEPSVAGVFGAYDREPAAPNFMSQLKNLSHAYVHETGRRQASTFWAGLGALRAEAFHAVGGFDERFARPSVEDIELGCRLVSAGYAIRLAPEHTGRHLKRWSFWGAVATDVRERGVPWTQIIHRRGTFTDDLNTSRPLRASVALAWLAVLSLPGIAVTPWAAVAASGLTAGLVALNADYYRWLAARRGWWFAARAVPVHFVHHVSNGVSFVVGTALFVTGRWGLRLPWSLPPSAWPSPGPIRR
jgi:GT2 family glycosyltransferase